MPEYRRWIENNIQIVDKRNQVVDFILNGPQERYMIQDAPSGPHIILKPRQLGFSSLILARFLFDFILTPNSVSVVVADIDENAQKLLRRLKFYLASFEQRHNVKVPLKYNNTGLIENAAMNSTYSIGTAKNVNFGRSQTITNLHLSEAAYYSNLQAILAGAGNAVIPDGYYVLETTANGFNALKKMWDEAVSGGNGFTPLFYAASEFYEPEYLAEKKKQLGRLYRQEFPETPLEAFLTSGDPYFDQDAMTWFNSGIKKPLTVFS